MTRKNQFWKGMFLGAIAGGAISLLDKQTREVMTDKVQKVSGKVAYVVRNPGEVTDKVKGTAAKLKDTFDQVREDISFITEKVDELKELTPQVADLIKETKDTFSDYEEEDLLDEVIEEKQLVK